MKTWLPTFDKDPAGIAGAGRRERSRRAFTLLEVMIATAILFIGTFAILGLISSTLSNARRLQRPLADANEVLAHFLIMTNQFDFGTANGNMGDLMGKDYKDYNYIFQCVPTAADPMGTNDVVELDVAVTYAGGNQAVLSTASTLQYDPGHYARSKGGLIMNGGANAPGGAIMKRSGP